MRIETVTCDGCGADITTRSNSVDYRLVLGSESKPGHGAGFYTAMMISPAIDRAFHFCDLGCLDHWSGRRRHRDQLSAEWWETWKREHGSTDQSGRCFSYPSPPNDVIEPARAQFEADALAAFPISHPPRKGD